MWAGFYEASSNFHLDPQPLREIIDSGTNLDRSDRDGLTLLHYAAREGHYDAVRMLVEVGVKLEQQDREYAARRSHLRARAPLCPFAALLSRLSSPAAARAPRRAADARRCTSRASGPTTARARRASTTWRSQSTCSTRAR